MKEKISRNKISRHYKSFFGLENMALAENDNLMIDWGESLINELVNQEVEKRIKERMGAEIEEFGIYVDLLKADADLMPDKHDYYKCGAQMAYSHCWFTFYRILEKLRSCLTCSEKPNNSQKTEGGEG